MMRSGWRAALWLVLAGACGGARRSHMPARWSRDAVAELPAQVLPERSRRRYGDAADGGRAAAPAGVSGAETQGVITQRRLRGSARPSRSNSKFSVADDTSSPLRRCSWTSHRFAAQWPLSVFWPALM